MWSKIRFSVVILILALAAPWRVMGQGENEFSRWSLGIEAGAFQPYGSWAEHRFAGVDLFNAGATFRGELEFRIKTKLGLALNASYAKLNLGDWVNYASVRGDQISASAGVTHFAGLLRLHLDNRKPATFFLEGGPSYIAPQGQESFAGGVYEYDFLKPSFGFATGIGYAHYFGKNTALVLRLSGLLAPSGIEYADGEKRDVIALPITAGLRFGL